MVRLVEINELENIKNTDKKELIKLIDKSKISTEELKEYVSNKTGDINLKVNDRKTLCRMITKFIN